MSQAGSATARYIAHRALLPHDAAQIFHSSSARKSACRRWNAVLLAPCVPPLVQEMNYATIKAKSVEVLNADQAKCEIKASHNTVAFCQTFSSHAVSRPYCLRRCRCYYFLRYLYCCFVVAIAHCERSTNAKICKRLTFVWLLVNRSAASTPLEFSSAGRFAQHANTTSAKRRR